MIELFDIKIWRYERKFVVSEFLQQKIELIIRLHPALFSEIHHQRWVNNIYFDSFSARNYHDNIEGLRNRVKVRIRWYGSFWGKVKEPMLEFKLKEGILGAKKIFPLSPFFIDEKIGVTGINDMIRNSDLPDLVKTYLSPLTPCLLNRYLRRYYRSWDRSYRITVDSGMECNTIGSQFQVLFLKDSDNINTILELKYDSSKDANVDTITNHFPFRMTKNSKYVNGIESTLV